jgi:hypothetical protein
MEHSVMKKYTTKSDQARHYVQYDQGEDRWLCTLLLKQRFRVEYSAASDVNCLFLLCIIVFIFDLFIGLYSLS